jgi:hypothetical protein
MENKDDRPENESGIPPQGLNYGLRIIAKRMKPRGVCAFKGYAGCFTRWKGCRNT